MHPDHLRQQLGLLLQPAVYLPSPGLHPGIPNRRRHQPGQRLRDHRRLDRVLFPPDPASEAGHPKNHDRRLSGLLPGSVQRGALYRTALVRGGGAGRDQAVPEGQDEGEDLRARQQLEHVARLHS